MLLQPPISTLLPYTTLFRSQKQFDGVISRAFASLQDMLIWCKHLPNQQGSFYALKGSDLDAIPEGFVLKQNIKLSVHELDAERRLMIIE